MNEHAVGRVVPALDLGGTYAKGAVIDAGDGTALWETRWDVPRGLTADGLVEQVATWCEHLLGQAARRLGHPADCLGVAVPGIVDDATGTAGFSANLGWRNQPLRARLAERLDFPVTLCHDVTAAGVGEAAFGAGRAAHTVLTVVAGTGIGGVLTIGGQPYRGAHHGAVELGHLPVADLTGLCGCGGRGHLETVAAGPAIVRRYNAATPAAPAADVPEVLARAAAGDATAAAFWDEAVAAFGRAVAQAVILLDPEVVVLAGGLSRSGAALRAPVAASLASTLTFHEPPPVLTSLLGDRAGVIGTALTAVRERTHG
ncbi:MAG: ROK family protein [Propionibacteriaceae bacterium]|nr:ROK family protein [Propionibacteriaceae bacterium]